MEPQTSQSQPPKNSRKKWIVIAAGVFVVLCLCVALAGSLGSGKETTGIAQPIAEPTVQPPALPTDPATLAPQTDTPVTQTQRPPRVADTPTPTDCQPASAALLTSIASGLTVNGEGQLINGWTVQSPDHANAYYVSAQIIGPGMDASRVIGIWATNRTDGTGMIFSVDAFAHEFSDWADGSKTDAEFSIADVGAKRVRECARN